MLIFCRKTSNLSKALCSLVIYYEFFVMKPLLTSSYCSIKRLFCQNYTLNYGSLRSMRWPFFLIFHGKVNALMPIFCIKNCHSLRNTLFWCNFIEIFHDPLLSSPYLFTKNTNSVITKLYYGLKMSTRCSFQGFFTKE